MSPTACLQQVSATAVHWNPMIGWFDSDLVSTGIVAPSGEWRMLWPVSSDDSVCIAGLLPTVLWNVQCMQSVKLSVFRGELSSHACS